jgi:hypothetical protein
MVRAEREPGIDLSLWKRMRALRAGFAARSWILYGFEDRPDETYLPDLPHLLYIKGANKDWQVFQNKLLFPAVYGALLDIPENLCIVGRGRVLPLSRSAGLTRSLDSVIEWCKRTGPMIWKPVEGLGGQAVHLISYESSGTFRVNGKQTDEEHLYTLAQGRADYLVCPAVPQGDYAHAIFPGSVNTVRMWTMVDPSDGKAFLAAAVHRFGTRKSAPVDNWAAGGLVAPIDMETGTLHAAASKPIGGRVSWFDVHPDTGAQIAGTRVPNWSKVVNSLLEVMEAYPKVSHCAWDVVVREKGFSVLEGNNSPTLTMLQLRGGLLRNERTRRFLHHHEVLAH